MKEGTGSNVTSPVVVFRVYVPWFATVREVPVHDATAVDVAQMPAGTAFRVVPVAAESFDSGVNVWLTSQLAVPASGLAVGGGVTVGVYVDDDVWPVFVDTWYRTGVAMPVTAVVHDAPAGVFDPEHGVKVTIPVVVSRLYVPSPATDIDVAEQLGGL